MLHYVYTLPFIIFVSPDLPCAGGEKILFYLKSCVPQLLNTPDVNILYNSLLPTKQQLTLS